MTIQFRITIAFWLVISALSAMFSFLLYGTSKQEYIEGIDRQLLAGAVMARAIVGNDYHDKINNKHSIAVEAYLGTVDTFNQICLESGYQYLWSNLFLDNGEIVFTTGTSPSKDINQGDHAMFFDVHSDPQAFDEVINTGITTFRTFQNEWGEGRMVLVPYQDAQGRTYVFGASTSLAEFNTSINRLAKTAALVSLLILIAATAISYWLSKRLSDPIKVITRLTADISAGKYGIKIDEALGWGEELEDLADNINTMSVAILDHNNELNNRELELKDILESSPDMIYRVAIPEGKYLFVSPAAEKIFGYKPESWYENPHLMSELVHPQWREFFINQWEELLKGEAPLTCDYQVMHSDGNVRWINQKSFTSFDEAGNAIALTAIVSDITKQKSIEKLLEKSREELEDKVVERTRELQTASDFNRMLFETSPIGLALTDMQGKLIDTNPAYLEIIGYCEDEVKDLSYWDITPKEYEPQEMAQLESMRATRCYGPYEKEYIHKDGSRVPVLLNGRIITRDNQDFIWSSIENISFRKAVEQQLLEAKYKAEEALQVKAQFLANMSHEIRTPMSGVLGMINLALETDLDAVQYNYLKKANTSATNLLNILNDILDFSKIEAGKLELETIGFQLSDVISNLKHLTQLKAVEKTISLEIIIDDNVPDKLVGDPLRLGQILINLVDNGIKFSGEGDAVSVHISLGKSNEQGQQLLFIVSDQGIGLSPQEQENLFQLFTQADSSTTRHYGGTGLGLAICKNIVDLMQGSIWLESVKGEGSRFYFTAVFSKSQSQVPSNKEANQYRQEDVERAIQELDGKSFLVVEDDDINLEIITELLIKHGVNIRSAVNGKEALKLLELTEFDAVLMDCQMPVMDGYQATRKIREQERFKDLPVLALTANAMKGDREKVLQVGMNDHIAKPIDPDQLLMKLAYWITPGSSIDGETGLIGSKILDTRANSLADSLSTCNHSENLNTLAGFTVPFPQLIGVDQFEGMANVGNIALYQKLLIKFRDRYTPFEPKFRAERQSEDPNSAIRYIHTLKGLAGTLGIHEVKDAASALQQAYRTKSTEEVIDTHVQELQSALSPVLIALEVLDYSDVKETSQHDG